MNRRASYFLFGELDLKALNKHYENISSYHMLKARLICFISGGNECLN
jgi:hypothetical protein